jgi:hypothetical protein
MRLRDDALARRDETARPVGRGSPIHDSPAPPSAEISLSGAVLPVETKTFDLADEAAAWAYLAEAGPASSGTMRLRAAMRRRAR